MDTSDPDIVFDADGVCNHCTAWFARADLHRLPREERTGLLETRVEEIKRRGHGKDYDCIIGVSGGVDSSYVAIKSLSRLRRRRAAGTRRQRLELRQGRGEHQAHP